MLILVVYDIAANRQRRRAAKLLEGYGHRVQRSVFECTLTKAQFQELQGRLETLRGEAASVSYKEYPGRTGAAAHKCFSVRCYRLCTPCTERTVVLGGSAVTRDEPFYVV